MFYDSVIYLLPWSLFFFLLIFFSFFSFFFFPLFLCGFSSQSQHRQWQCRDAAGNHRETRFSISYPTDSTADGTVSQGKPWKIGQGRKTLLYYIVGGKRGWLFVMLGVRIFNSDLGGLLLLLFGGIVLFSLISPGFFSISFPVYTGLFLFHILYANILYWSFSIGTDMDGGQTWFSSIDGGLFWCFPSLFIGIFIQRHPS